MYVTINDIVLNPAPSTNRRPFGSSSTRKSMEHFQWIVALTRIMSAVFRKGGDVTFLVEEMKAVFDPRGGYFKGRRRVHAVAGGRAGQHRRDHLKSIGMLHDRR